MRSRTITKTSYAGMIGAILIVAAWRLYTGDVQTTEFGQFRLTEHRRLHPFGNRLAKTTLCSRTTTFCVEDHELQLSPSPEFGTPPFTLVNGNENQTVLHFLDTTSGSELRCRNCDMPLVELLRQSTSGLSPTPGVIWSPSGNYAALRSAEKARSPFLFLLEFEPGGISATRIPVPRDALAEHPRTVRFSPNSDALAWYECAPHCVLWSYRISDRRSERRPTPCPYNDYLDIGWDGDAARAQVRPDATAREKSCFDADGKPVLPFR